MAPRSRKRGEPVKGRCVKKATPARGTRTGLRSQTLPSNSGPVQSYPPCAEPVTEAARNKRQRVQEREAVLEQTVNEPPATPPENIPVTTREPSLNILQRDTQTSSIPHQQKSELEQPQPLSDEDLRSLYEEVMAHTAAHRSPRKETLNTSRTYTASSRISHVAYRYNTLEAANVHFHAEPPPDVKAAVKEILSLQPSTERQDELAAIAQGFRDNCLENARGHIGEGGWMKSLDESISALRVKNLRAGQNAVWLQELKPVIRTCKKFDVNLALGRNPDTNVAQPNDASPIAQEIPPSPFVCPVKTPNSDVLLGIDLRAITSDLAAQYLGDVQARKFLNWVQTQMIPRGPEGVCETMLPLIPCELAARLAFPFLTIEGKASETGRQIFEAENQAAVSMACAHKLLHCLDRMGNGKQTRVLFSITTQGPIHELWAHWVSVREGEPFFESKLWNSWNVLVKERAVGFIVVLNCLCTWGTGPFMESVIKRLGEVAKKSMGSDI